MNLGLIGCGAIGSIIAREVGSIDRVEVLYIWDIDRRREDALVHLPKIVATDFDGILENCSLVIEASSQRAVRDYVPVLVERGKEVMIMSVGAFADQRFYRRMREMAEISGSKIYIPSGAICGMDGIKAAMCGRVERVILTTTKPPGALSPTEEFTENTGIDPSSLKERTLIFEGTAEEAVRFFPRNVNVAATLKIACLPFGEPIVRIVVDPYAERNRHEIVLEGEFGRIVAETDNVPSPNNPRTSYIAALSAIATLRQILDPVRVGT